MFVLAAWCSILIDQSRRLENGVITEFMFLANYGLILHDVFGWPIRRLNSSYLRGEF